MPDFAHSENLIQLAWLPLLILAFLLYLKWRKRSIALLSEPSLFDKLMKGVSKSVAWRSFVLPIVAIALLVLALANPQIGNRAEKSTSVSMDIVFAIDISNSMMADDVKPSRLERTKQFCSRLIDGFGSDRVGIVFFAGAAYEVMPLTTDYGVAKMDIATLSPTLANAQGTDIGAALQLSQQLLMDAATAKSAQSSKAIILITDGEDHEGGVEEQLKAAEKNGVQVFAIGVGSKEGAKIPLYERGEITGYQRDQQGNVVTSKMNEEMLKELASKTQGEYFQLGQDNSSIKGMEEALASLKRTERPVVSYASYQSIYQWFAFAGLVLILIDSLLPGRKVKLKNIFAKSKI